MNTTNVPQVHMAGSVHDPFVLDQPIPTRYEAVFREREPYGYRPGEYVIDNVGRGGTSKGAFVTVGVVGVALIIAILTSRLWLFS